MRYSVPASKFHEVCGSSRLPVAVRTLSSTVGHAEGLRDAADHRNVVGRGIAHAELRRGRRVALRLRVGEGHVGPLDGDALGAEAHVGAYLRGRLREPLQVERVLRLLGVGLAGGRVDGVGAVRAAAVPVPVRPVVAGDDRGRNPAGLAFPAHARRERVAVAPGAVVEVEQAAEAVVLEERRTRVLAVAEVGGGLERAEALAAGQGDETAVALGVVVRRGGLARIGGDLRLGQRAGQAQVLAVETEAQAETAVRVAPARVAEQVLLRDVVVLAVAVRLQAVGVERKSRLLVGDVQRRAQVARVVAAVAAEHASHCAVRPRRCA